MDIVDSVMNPDGIFINTQCFREEALNFKKYGRYCDDEVGTYGHTEYWEEQEQRLIHGYESGGVRITGEHYGYLNFSQIKLSKMKEDLRDFNPRIKASVSSNARTKTRDFPAFFDGDYNYFHVVDIARNGISKEDLDALHLMVTPMHLQGGKHICLGKARRKGYSYKAGYNLAHRYKTEPNSISVVAAHDWKYLIQADGTMTMARNCVDFFNEHTGFARQKLVKTKTHQKDGFIETVNGIDIEKGYKSQIISVSCGDNSDAIRGKDGSIVYLEEAGKFPNLIDTINSTLPTLEDGIYVTGIMIVFGTGGGDDSNWEGFEEVFYDPDTYNMLPIDNVWDKNSEGTSCGYFHPDYINKIGFVDKAGNSEKQKAIDYEEAKREQKRKTSKDSSALTAHKMEFPFTPGEAFSRTSNNIFPVDELVEQRNFLLTNKHNDFVIGKLRRTREGLVEYLVDFNLQPILKFPHKNVSDLTGCIIKYEEPYKIAGKIPDYLHIICHDPYAFDKSTGDVSIGAAYVLRRNNNLGVRGDVIVASWIGKPETQDDYNKALFFLAEYYNAKIGFENDRGNVIGYAKEQRAKGINLFKWLEDEFELGWSDKINNNLSRSYGMSMSGGADNTKKVEGDIFIRDWLNGQRGKTEDGLIIKNLHLIKDIALLEELIKYRLKGGNYDRVSALRIGMYYMREITYRNIQIENSKVSKNSSKKRFFKSKLF
jgi:hypothetical protein